ncbi:MAG: NAD(P)/FAD-dependent oxidoreductase [Chloroflexota bacterium]|nr:NAD(P)/FAD-dependent oxidoreductase [Chloroflexota bacterium]
MTASPSTDHADAPPALTGPRGVGRRALLRAGLGGAASLLGARHVSAQLGPGELAASPRRVLVLGAGMSGLTAALALHRRGHDVQVIEYQNRAGGRLLSVPLKGGQFTEAGGGHFRSNMPLVLRYLRAFTLPVVSLNDGLPRYLIGGETAQASDLADWPWPLTDAERNLTVSSNLNRYLFLNDLNTTTVLDPAWPDAATLQRLDGLTTGDLIRRVGGSDAFVALLDAHGGTFTSRSPALGAIPDLAYHFGDQNLFRIRGGNDLLPQAMADQLGGRVVLNAPVTAIDQTGPSVRVTVADGREFTADAVISTIPFTVLQEIDVRPAWTVGKRRMFTEMVWDNTVKVIVQTRTPAWLAHGVHGWPMAGGDRPWERVIDITGNEPGGYGNVFFYLNGSNADNVLSNPVATRAQQVVDAFRADMPDLFDEVVTVQDFAWPEQPWIRASFGGPPVNGGWMIAEWTRPEGRLHFAGDFTTMKSGWVEGAIESGLRAARQVDSAITPEEDVPGAEG